MRNSAGVERFENKYYIDLHILWSILFCEFFFVGMSGAVKHPVVSNRQLKNMLLYLHAYGLLQLWQT